MGTGISIFFITIGAILTFAVEATTNGVDLNAIGVILMVVGVLGLLFSLVLWDNWNPNRPSDYVDDRDIVVRRRNEVIVDDEPVVQRTVRRSYR